MEQYEYNKITPFKWFVLENFPYIEEDFDALTNWQLFGKIGKKINDIINSQNNVGIQMESVTNAFIVLETYVHDYFDNLDVQEEINNKLDQMALDGTLTRLVARYVQPQIDEQNERIQSFQNQISALNTGSPIPVDNVNQMTDTSKMYVLTTSGYWYYYNGTTWTPGGIFQSPVDGETVQNIQNALESNDMMETIVEAVDPSRENYYIANNGNFSYSTNYNCSQIIHLTKGESLEITCYTTSAAGCIVEYPGGFGSSYNPYNILVMGESSNSVPTHYKYTAENDIDIFICYNKTHDVSDITINRINIIGIKPSILVVKDSAKQLSVYSWHQNKKRYLRHTFIHKVITSDKTTTGETMETQNCWFAQKILDGDNEIAQGNSNFIHNIWNNNEPQGYSGQGDGSCKSIATQFFLDGKLLDFSNMTTNLQLQGEKFTFINLTEMYECTGGGTEDSAEYRTVVVDGNFVVESTNNIIYEITANSNIKIRNTLNIKRDNTQYYECFCAMSCGFYPYFDNIIVNSDGMDWNNFLISDGHFVNNAQHDSESMPYNSIKADTVVIFGDDYKMTTRALPVDGENKVNTYLKTYTSDGRLKTYLLPCICRVSDGDIETFNNGDKLDFIVERSIELK